LPRLLSATASQSGTLLGIWGKNGPKSPYRHSRERVCVMVRNVSQMRDNNLMGLGGRGDGK
jgi:hypothetical protein